MATTREKPVTLDGSLVEALWLAMHQDDDLATDYAERCILNGLVTLVNEMPFYTWSPRDHEKLYRIAHEQRKRLMTSCDEMSDRFASYDEPPF